MYNAEKFIASMIKAIQNQSYTNFEVIIVDDQSTDNSVEVVKKMVTGKAECKKPRRSGVCAISVN